MAHGGLLGGDGNVSILSEVDSNGLFHHKESVFISLFPYRI